MQKQTNPPFNFISSEIIPSHSALLKAKQTNNFHSNIVPLQRESKIQTPVPQHLQSNSAFLSNYQLPKINYQLDSDYNNEQFINEKQRKKFYCSCKKSKCLKLYCDCFANSEYCINCNCVDCENVINNKDNIKKCFEDVVDKNPLAMKTSINLDKNFGCNCTKSNCLKKYCECYKAGKHCNDTCRCRDCDNLPKKDIAETALKKRENFKNFDISKYTNGFISKSFNANERLNLYNNYGLEKTEISLKNGNIQIKQNKVNFDNNNNKLINVKLINNITCIEIPKCILSQEVLREAEKIKRVHAVFNHNMQFEYTTRNANKDIQYDDDYDNRSF